MRERRRDGILLAGSLSGFLGSAQISVYSAVKAFCRIFAEGLWLEMQDHNVDVLELVLGLTRTPAMDRGGLKMDTPGLQISEPRDVATQGLVNLANGPVVVVKQFEAAAEKNSGHNRAELFIGGACVGTEAASASGRVEVRTIPPTTYRKKSAVSPRSLCGGRSSRSSTSWSDSCAPHTNLNRVGAHFDRLPCCRPGVIVDDRQISGSDAARFMLIGSGLGRSMGTATAGCYCANRPPGRHV